SLRAAWTPAGPITTAATIVSTINAPSRFITGDSPLERVCRVGAQDERGLKEPLVHEPAAAAIVVEQIASGAVGVLVGEPESQELGGIKAQVWFHGPLVAGIRGVLRGVIAHAERPAPPRLKLAPAVPAKAVARLAALDLAHRVNALRRQ